MNTIYGSPVICSYSSFRFLYGRWILGCLLNEFLHTLVQIPLWSMNTSSLRLLLRGLNVQIPLWSMNTSGKYMPSLIVKGSDSSMVDEYPQSNSGSSSLRCSDSSMVDEYTGLRKKSKSRPKVQIPLWSMNTVWKDRSWNELQRSDSSMVDEYPIHRSLITKRLSKFRFLYGRWILYGKTEEIIAKIGSDSSMVDEYYPSSVARKLTFEFRFLYGRWIPIKRAGHRGSVDESSDSSMVDEYVGIVQQDAPGEVVQIPLWSMNTKIAVAIPVSRRVQIPLWSMNT